ncbi:hypothetical protein Tco_0678691 [Tanacetum coccineum]|uniref:Uncharacterized protein n=1 Tax=Tanacetum coccineum TaxID=301880 RepID=A0ABQ4XFS5_9ASTR
MRILNNEFDLHIPHINSGPRLEFILLLDYRKAQVCMPIGLPFCKELKLSNVPRELSILRFRIELTPFYEIGSIPICCSGRDKMVLIRVLELLVPLLELNLFEILLGELEEGRVASSGWPFVFAVPGQMTHLVASLTLNSARSCVMQVAFLNTREGFHYAYGLSVGARSTTPDSFLPYYSDVVCNHWVAVG